MAPEPDPPDYNPEADWETTRSPAFAAALSQMQAELPRIPRTATGQVGPRQYKYPPYEKILAKVRPVLRKHQFVWNTRPTLTVINNEVRFVLAYKLTWLPTGEKEAGDFPLTEGAAQAQGSQISFAKRYTLGAVLDLEIIGEDDDAQQAEEHEEPRRRNRPAQRGPVPPEQDHWTDQPPGQLNGEPYEPEKRASTPLDGRQRSQIFAKFRVLGIAEPTRQRAVLSEILKRQVSSRKGLSYADAETVLKDLQARIEAKEAADEAAAAADAQEAAEVDAP